MTSPLENNSPNLLDFRKAGRLRRLNWAAQVILAIALLGWINYLASGHFHRMDLTREKLFSLSPETRAYLERLDREVTIYVTTSGTPEGPELKAIQEDLHNLLREYAYASSRSQGARIQVETIDIFRDRTRARELTTRYGPQPENVILVTTETRSRQVFLDELFVIERGKITAFQGERVISSAILEVVSDEEARIYFSTGHGEMRIDSPHPVRGMSALEQLLNERGLQTSSLNLTQVSQLPDDARALVIAAPTARFRDAEIQKIRRFLRERDGGVFLLLEPGADNHLDSFLGEWGIVADDALIVDPGADFQRSSGDLFLRRFADHPITSLFPELQLSLITGLPRPVRVVEEKILQPEGLRLTTLLTTSESSWADFSYREGDRAVFDEERDLRGPVGVAVAGRRHIEGIAGLTIPESRGGRLVVVGSGDLAANNHFHAYGNQFFMLNAVNWTMDRGSALNIPHRPFRQNLIVLSESQLRRIMVWLLAPAMLMAGGGLVIAVLRR